jgi:hypothetical protein
MFCTECGRKIADDVGFCINCREGKTEQDRAAAQSAPTNARPIRQHAIAGIAYGFLAGVFLHVALLGIVLARSAPSGACHTGSLCDAGTMILGLLPFPVLGLVLKMLHKARSIRWVLFLAPIGVLIEFGANAQLVGMILGAATGGGILWSAPGMAIGASIGAVRRRRLSPSNDAPQEKAVLLVAIPSSIAVVLWVVALLWARSYLIPTSQ